MKTTKCMLSIALVLAVVLGLFIPAVAAETCHMPIIISAPTDQQLFPVGTTSAMFEVVAELPAGDDGELTIEWITLSRPSQDVIAYGPVLYLDFTVPG